MPQYQGPSPAPNRFNIRPGYRWGLGWPTIILDLNNQTANDYLVTTLKQLCFTGGMVWTAAMGLSRNC